MRQTFLVQVTSPNSYQQKAINWVGKASAAEISDKSGIFVSKGAFTLAKFVAEKPKKRHGHGSMFAFLGVASPKQGDQIVQFFTYWAAFGSSL